MRISYSRVGKVTTGLALALVGAGFLVACKDDPTGPSGRLVVGEGQDFRTIAEAVQAAPAGATIQVLRGTYGERIVITKPLKLESEGRATLDGQAGGLDGRGIGIHVLGAAGVEISGFTVQNFERGIVLENASGCRIVGNEVRNNDNRTAQTSPPLAPGVTPYEGIVLIASNNNTVRSNFIHDNGHDGVMLSDGSSANEVAFNVITDNGRQTAPGTTGPFG